jgi:hypothetical protein
MEDSGGIASGVKTCAASVTQAAALEVVGAVAQHAKLAHKMSMFIWTRAHSCGTGLRVMLFNSVRISERGTNRLHIAMKRIFPIGGDRRRRMAA